MNTFLGFAFLALAFYGLIELIDAFESWTIKRSPVPKAVLRLVLFLGVFWVSALRPHWSDFIVGAVAWTILLQPQTHILRSIPRRCHAWWVLRKAKRSIRRMAERDEAQRRADMPTTAEAEAQFFADHPVFQPDSFVRMDPVAFVTVDPIEPPEETTRP